MNNDLISREALKNDLITFFPDKCLEGITAKTLFKQILTDIDNAPTVDLSAKWAEAHSTGYDVGYTKGLEDARPKGEWIKKTFEFPVFSGEGDFLIPDIKIAYECSKCNTHWDYTSNFCPNCGAEMVHDATCKDWAEAGKEISRGIHDAVRPKDEDDTWKDDMQRDADAYFETGGEP